MADQTKQIDRVGALANRLRLLQIDYADQTDEVRREYLAEEVRRVLTIIPPNERQAFLAELQDRFPTWENKLDIASQVASQPNPATPAASEKELNDPGFLVTHLIELCKSLSEAARREVTGRLTSAGIAGAGTPAAAVTATASHDWPQPQLSELRAKLQIPTTDKIDPARGLELLAQLTEFATNLDKVAWSTWRTLHPSSVHRRSTPLLTTLGRFAVGDAAVGRDQLVNELKLLRQLTGALIATLSQTGRIAIQHFRSLAPEEIKLLVGPKGFNRESAYWRKYEELAGSMDVPTTEEAIRAGLVAFAEPLIHGGR